MTYVGVQSLLVHSVHMLLLLVIRLLGLLHLVLDLGLLLCSLLLRLHAPLQLTETQMSFCDSKPPDHKARTVSL